MRLPAIVYIYFILTLCLILIALFKFLKESSLPITLSNPIYQCGIKGLPYGDKYEISVHTQSWNLTSEEYKVPIALPGYYAGKKTCVIRVTVATLYMTLL